MTHGLWPTVYGAKLTVNFDSTADGKNLPSSAALTSCEKKFGGNLFETSKLSASIPWNNNPSSVKDLMIILNPFL